jgi:hypothetical protein
MPGQTVFLSHSSADNSTISNFVGTLRTKNVVLLADEQIQFGDPIPRWMSEALGRADKLILAWSRSAQTSPHVWNELDAFYMRKPGSGHILFMKLDDTPVPTLYASRKYVKWSGDANHDASLVEQWANGEAPEALEDGARQNILAYVGKAPIVTFDYTDNRATQVSAPQLKLPDTSAFTLIAEASPFNGGDFTVNAVATIFNAKPQGLVNNTLRDFQVSSQLDVPLNRSSVAKVSDFVMSFSGEYQRVLQNVLPMINSTPTISNPDAALKGDIATGQIKVTIPLKGSGVKIPVSFTVANRTELIKERDIRGT